MGASVRPIDLSDADLYESYRDRGLSHEAAVRHVERRRSAAVRPEPEATGPGKARAALFGAGQGATSGWADKIVGAMMALSLKDMPVDSSIADVQRQFSDARNAHPFVATGGNIAGTVLSPLNRLLGPLTQGVGATAKAATYGGVLGGAQGFGEVDGTLKDRAIGAGVGSGVGAVLGGGLGFAFGRGGKAASQMWRNLRGAFAKTERAVTQQLGKTVPPETLQQVQEAAHRAFLQKQGFSQEVIDRLMETWRAGGKLPAKPPVAPSARPAQARAEIDRVVQAIREQPLGRPPRAGETITQVSPRGFEVTGARETPPVPGTPTLLEMQSGQRLYPTAPDIGRGSTLPYYPRGGRVEQTLGSPPPAPSVPPKLGPNQNQVFVEFLKGATPEDLPGRVETLRSLGVPLPADAERQFMQLLFGATP